MSDGDRLIAHGEDGKAVYAAAHNSGVERPLITRIEAANVRYGFEFDLLYHYDTRLTGSTLPVGLAVGGREATATAQLDTEANFCIFDRLVAEDLWLTVEDGEPQSIAP